MSSKARMKRLFKHGGCLDVAIDHGVCNEPSFMVGLDVKSFRLWRFVGAVLGGVFVAVVYCGFEFALAPTVGRAAIEENLTPFFSLG
jgi:hypothetical protein